MITAAASWRDYELIDASDRERLERWGRYILVRPDPQVVWKTERTDPLWAGAHAVYHRSSQGGGSWEYRKKLPEQWLIDYKGLFRMKVSPTGFKHTGVFPEQAANWDRYIELIKGAGRPIKVLNLFAYTGGATLACLSAGASVCHVDASRGMVDWAKQNVELSGFKDRACRFIVDDCQKFVAREIRRGVKYDGLILDPPSYGRGPSGEMFRLEDNIYELMLLCAGVMAERPLFVALNSYTAGLSPSVMGYIMETVFKGRGAASCGEIGLRVKDSGFVLPCGNTAWLTEKEIYD